MIRTAASLLAPHRARPGVGCPLRRLASAPPSAWPRSCDVLVVGGGAVGSSSAYHLKQRAGGELSVAVLEPDPAYTKASTVLSCGNIRQQFSVAENIQLSMSSFKFLSRASELLAVDSQEPPDVGFIPCGYLFLATPEGLEQMKENYELQTSLGAEVAWLWPRQLRQRYPWLAFGKNVAAGVVGTNNEGRFDPWTLLLGLRRKAESLGAVYLPARLTGLQYRPQEHDGRDTAAPDAAPARTLTTAMVRLRDGEEREISFSTLVVAAGAWSGEVGRLAGLGTGEGALATPIPVEPRKRYFYHVHAPDGPWEGCPVFNDYTGMTFMPDPRPQHFVAGRSPREEEEPDAGDLEVDYDFFDTHVWPLMAERSPSFGNLKVKSAWAGYYDYNTLDQNLIIGFHPVYTNMCLATGMSGHGIQQSPAIGRAVMECVADGRSHSINLDRFGFGRILNRQPLKEKLVM